MDNVNAKTAKPHPGQLLCMNIKTTSAWAYMSARKSAAEKLVKDLSTMDDVTQLMQKAYKQCDANSWIRLGMQAQCKQVAR